MRGMNDFFGILISVMWMRNKKKLISLTHICLQFVLVGSSQRVREWVCFSLTWWLWMWFDPCLEANKCWRFIDDAPEFGSRVLFSLDLGGLADRSIRSFSSLSSHFLISFTYFKYAFKQNQQRQQPTLISLNPLSTIFTSNRKEFQP